MITKDVNAKREIATPINKRVKENYRYEKEIGEDLLN